MKKIFKHIIKVAAILIMIICWILAIGYTNELGLRKNTFNIYLEDGAYNVLDFYNLRNQEKNEDEIISFTGWYEKENQQVVNSNFNRTINTNVVLICGNSSLVVNGPLLFDDDKNGCLLDEKTAQELFGNINVIGNTIKYGDRELVVRGIHKGMDNTVIVQALEDSNDKIQGISIDISKDKKENIKLLKERYGFNDQGVNSKIYYNIGKFSISILPIVILLGIIINIMKLAILNKNKPVAIILSIIFLMASIIIFSKITRYKITIPVDILPNKWSDFDYWKKLYDECLMKIEYFIYMRKYSIDRYCISYLIKIALCTIITLSLYFINIKNIKIENTKKLFILSLVMIVITYIALIICTRSSIDEKELVTIWGMPIYYLICKYMIFKKEKLLTYN